VGNSKTAAFIEKLPWALRPRLRYLRLQIMARNKRGERANAAERCLLLLGPIATPAIPDLTRLAAGADTNSQTAARALYVMTWMGSEGYASLLRVLRDNTNSSRQYAASIIGSRGRPPGIDLTGFVPVLARLVNDQDQLVAEAAMRALGQLKLDGPVAIPVLTNALANQSRFRRIAAMQALGNFGPEARSAAPLLLSMLEHTNSGVRLAATNALQKIAPEQTP